MSATTPIVPAATVWSSVGRWLPAGRQAFRELLPGLLPSSWRQRLGLERRRLLLCLRPSGLLLQESREGRAKQIGALRFDEAELFESLRRRFDQSAAEVPRWLVLDAAQVLVRPMPLPLASEAHLQGVLAHEIDRQTPFSVDQVSYEGRVIARDVVQKQLRVELVVLPKSRLEAALAQLGPLAEGLAGVDVELSDGQRLGVNLLPVVRRAIRNDRSYWLDIGLAVTFAVLVLLALGLALQQRKAVLLNYQQRVSAATTEAREARQLRNQLLATTTAENFLAGRRAQQPTSLELLNDVSHRLPDSTWLEKISVNDGNMVLIGQSQQASALVGLLQGSTLIVTPALTGSVQTDPRTGRERFTMTAKIAGMTKEVPDARTP